MSNAFKDVESQALNLPDTERAELAERLVESLLEPANPSAQAAWLELAKKRRTELLSGSVKAIPGEEGSAMIRRLVGR